MRQTLLTQIQKNTPTMTRINLIPPEELCDQHLLAEHRELTRIPNAVARGKFSLE